MVKTGLAIAYLLTIVVFHATLPLRWLFAAEWGDVTSLWNWLSGSMWTWSLCWATVAWLGALLLLGLIRLFWKKGRPILLFSMGFSLSLAGTLAATGVFSKPSAQDRFTALMVLSGREDWKGIIDYAQRHPSANPLEINIVNLAYAELGQLADRFSRQRNPKVQDLFALEINSPYVAALLSDIYWSMGEISMSQMYAFEANEKLGNLSPRLLRRLVKTNILFGYYAVAEKYLNLLETNPSQRAFVRHYRSLLSDEAVSNDNELHTKQLCIPEENGFPSSRSLPYDLQVIVQKNPAHHTSAQYLRAIQVLAR